MEEKIRPIHFTATDGDPWELHQPAFLVGNGINYADKCKFSWEDLLINVLTGESYSPQNKQDKKKRKALIKTLKGLTYPEIAELALSKNSPEEFDKNSKSDFMKKVTEEIKNCIENSSQSNFRHEKLVEFAQKHSIPILTTNFDRNFLKTFCKKDLDSVNMHWVKSDLFTRNNYKTLRNAYFSPESFSENSDIHSEFALWHIHGVVSQPKSVCFTNWDYGNYYSEIKRISKLRNKTERKGNSTWVDILLDNDLIIMGLALDSFETDLRALLVERHIQQKINAGIAKENGIYREPKTIYIYRKKAEISEMPNGKRELFESLGIKCVSMAQNDIYGLKYLK